MNPAARSGEEALVVFARAPELGRVKTRLAVEVGETAALAAYRALGTACWTSAMAARDATGCLAVVAFTPANSEPAVRAWLGGGDAYVAQEGGDLGERMRHAIAAAIGAGARRVVVIGTDCPTLTAELLGKAFAALGEADVVIGPATDGGYYLVGMSRAHADLFIDVPWSSPLTRAVTLDRATDAGLHVTLLQPLSDVDTLSDWRRWQRALGQGA